MEEREFLDDGREEVGETIKLKASMKPNTEKADAEAPAKKKGGKVAVFVVAGLLAVGGGIAAMKLSKSNDKKVPVSSVDVVANATVVQNEAEFDNTISVEEATSEANVNYAVKLSDVPADKQNIISLYGEDVYKKNVASEFRSSEELVDFQSVGSIFLTKGEEAEGDFQNKLYQVYKVTVRNTYVDSDAEYDETASFFWYIGFQNLVVKEDGTIDINLNNYELPVGEIKINSGIGEAWSYKGWNSVDEVAAGIASINPGYEVENHVDKNAAK